MKKAEITAQFSSDIHTVWDAVTDNHAYKWRSDIDCIKILDKEENIFIEHTKDGFETKFTITKKIPYCQYEFDMENKNFTGHWIGIFRETNVNSTEVQFINKFK